MEDNELQKVLLENYKQIPSDLQNVVRSPGLKEQIKLISQNYSLDESQLNSLSNDTLFVLLGMMHPADFVKSLAEDLEMDESKAREIGQTVNEQIFRPVRDSLKRIHGIEAPHEPEAIPEEEKKYIDVMPKKTEMVHEEESVHGENRDSILQGIENPRAIGNPNYVSEPTPEVPENLPAKYPIPAPEERLQKIVSIPKEHLEITTPPPVREKKYSTDPYREPIEPA